MSHQQPRSGQRPLVHHLSQIAIAAGFCCHLAHAQQATPTAGEGSDVQEVVVTATKRVTLASKTPAALTVLTGDDLKSEGAGDARRLAEITPNLQIGNASLGAVQVAIRGIGSTNNTEVGDAAAGFSIDGVFLGRPQMSGAALYDLERVEVLRGPQGTLYGRNSTAGAINIITRKPERHFEANVGLGLSSFKGLQLDAMVNVPVNEVLAMRGVASVAKHDGYTDTAHAPANTFSRDKSDQDNQSARLHALLKPVSGTTLLLSADYSRDTGAGAGPVSYNTLAANPKGAAGRFVATSRYEGHERNTAGGFSAQLDQKLALGDLTVIAGHRQQDRALLYSVAEAGAGNFNGSKFKQDSVEARIASSGSGPVQWVGGLYYFKETGEPIVLDGYGAQLLFVQRQMKTDSVAAFGQATFAVREDLRLTAGLRQTQDKKSRLGCTYPYAALNAAGLSSLTDANNPLTAIPTLDNLPACPTAGINDASVKYNKTTYRLGVEHDLSKATLLYATYSTGFKAGGFNDGNLATAVNKDAVVYRPEELKAFELGAKGRAFDRKLQYSIAAFQYDFTDLQLSALTTCLSGSGTCVVTQNAAKAKSTGVEVEGRVAIGSSGKLNFGLAWTDAHYTRFTTPTGVVWDKHKLDKAPSSTANLGYTHEWTVGGGGLAAYVGLRYSSSYLLSNPAAATHFTQPSYHKTDVRLTYTSPSGNWYVQAYGRNLENRNTMTGFQSSGPVNAVFLAEPRILGIRGSVSF